MHSLKAILVYNPKDYQNIMMWAACCVAFFGSLHCSEFTVPNQTSYDHTIHLSYSDVIASRQQNILKHGVFSHQAVQDRYYV